MKKLLLFFTLVLGANAFAGEYMDGVYRGCYISSQETQIEVQFELKDDVIQKAKYRTLYYKGHNWLKEEPFIQMNKGYLGALNYLVGKKPDSEVLNKLYVPQEIEKAGATVRGGKLRYAIKTALAAGPVKLLKK